MRALAWVVLVAASLALVNLAPTLSLRTSGMQQLTGEHVRLFHQDEEAAAQEVFALAEGRAAELADLLGVQEPVAVTVYVYDDQATMQRKKYGLFAPLLGLDWYIGDNIGTDVLLTSPANPGPAHDHDTVRDAVLHEIVHAMSSVADPGMSYWLDNGLAGYLSGQEPTHLTGSASRIPTLEQTRVRGPLAPLRFADMDGYAFSYTYVEHLTEAYGWPAVRELAQGASFEEAVGRTEEQVHQEWTEFVRERYRVGEDR